jgi:hypothetical protein
MAFALRSTENNILLHTETKQNKTKKNNVSANFSFIYGRKQNIYMFFSLQAL